MNCMRKMEIKFDLENEPLVNLKHIKDMINNRISREDEYFYLSSFKPNVANLLEELLHVTGRSVSVSEFIERFCKEGHSEKEASEIIEQLKKEGEIFEPSRGFLERVKE